MAQLHLRAFWLVERTASAWLLVLEGAQDVRERLVDPCANLVLSPTEGRRAEPGQSRAWGRTLFLTLKVVKGSLEPYVLTLLFLGPQL